MRSHESWWTYKVSRVKQVYQFRDKHLPLHSISTQRQGSSPGRSSFLLWRRQLLPSLKRIVGVLSFEFAFHFLLPSRRKMKRDCSQGTLDRTTLSRKWKKIIPDTFSSWIIIARLQSLKEITMSSRSDTHGILSWESSFHSSFKCVWSKDCIARRQIQSLWFYSNTSSSSFFYFSSLYLSVFLYPHNFLSWLFFEVEWREE